MLNYQRVNMCCLSFQEMFFMFFILFNAGKKHLLVWEQDTARTLEHRSGALVCSHESPSGFCVMLLNTTRAHITHLSKTDETTPFVWYRERWLLVHRFHHCDVGVHWLMQHLQNEIRLVHWLMRIYHLKSWLPARIFGCPPRSTHQFMPSMGDFPRHRRVSSTFSWVFFRTASRCSRRRPRSNVIAALGWMWTGWHPLVKHGWKPWTIESSGIFRAINFHWWWIFQPAMWLIKPEGRPVVCCDFCSRRDW